MNIHKSSRTDWVVYLECQGCFKELRQLTESERRMIQEKPYDFVVFCSTCVREGNHIQEGF